MEMPNDNHSEMASLNRGMLHDTNWEMISLNPEFISFNASNEALSIEYVEQRLEAAMREPCKCIGRCNRRFVELETEAS